MNYAIFAGFSDTKIVKLAWKIMVYKKGRASTQFYNGIVDYTAMKIVA